MARCRAASPLYAVPAEVVSAERAKQSAKCGRNLQIFADRRFRRILRYPQTVQVCLSWPLQIFLSFRAPFFLFRLKCLISISQEVVPWACAAQPQQVETLHSRPQVAGGHEVFKKIWWYMIKIGLLYVALCQLVNFRLLFDSNLTIFDFLDQSHLITKRATKSTERQNILKPRKATYRFPYSASLCPVRLQHVVLHAAAIAFQWLHFQVQAKIPSHNVPFSYFASLWPRRQVNRVQLIQDDNHIKWHWICVYIYIYI